MKQYVIKTFLLILTGLLGVALFNAVVDPLDIYRFVRLTGFNDMKPRLDKYSRMAKPIWLKTRPYERLALGSSRTEIGIPINPEGWGAYTGPGMNGAVSGARLTEVAEIFHHATLTSPIKTVVIGADFFMFNGHTLGSYSSPQGLAQYNSEIKLLLNQAAYTLFSFNITGSSLYTITRQRPKYDKYRASGQMNSDREAAKSQQSGYQNRFKRFADSFMDIIWSPCKSNAYAYKRGRFDSMEMFSGLLDRAVAHNIEVKLFIPPAHAQLMEALYAAGHWQRYEQWKRDMVEVIVRVKMNTSQANIELWDFSGYNVYTMEDFPIDGGRMKWYIDSTHFSEAFGQLMVDRMYGQGGENIGIRLTQESVEHGINRIRDEQQDYRRQHPEVLDTMKKSFQKIHERKKKTGNNC